MNKGLWAPEGDAEIEGRTLFDGPFSFPVMVLRHSAIEANIATMAGYCERHGVLLAPHGKTTMVPELFRAQLEAGAWGITVATAHQALVALRAGAPRVLLANEVLEPAVVRWAAGQGSRLLCYVDSDAGVRVMREALAEAPGRLGVLIEIGYSGGRAGCREVAQAERLARELTTVDGVDLVGVAGFEGLLLTVAQVRGFLDTMLAAADAVAPMCEEPLLLSAGGSRFFDIVVDAFGPPARERGWRVLLRSGCYLTHDHGFYAQDSPFGRDPSQGQLRPAIEVWAQVLSAPEPGLAVLGAGKRDLPSDLGLPVALEVRGRDGGRRPVASTPLSALNDQHGFLEGVPVEPGELVRLGISHPCTAFDRWRVIPLVDDDYRVIELLYTYF